jgi:FkbM family methyltransferase
MEPRLTADLDIKPGDLIWDVGGFEGYWSKDIFEKYGRYTTIFEPVPSYAAQLRAGGYPFVREYGLSDYDHEATITIAGDRSSTFEMGYQGTDKVKIRLQDASKVLGTQQIKVLKLNIEGGEYAVLDRLIATDKLRQIGTLLVQFHAFNSIPDGYGERYLAIKKGMLKTHSLTWRDPFIWERWDRIGR